MRNDEMIKNQFAMVWREQIIDRNPNATPNQEKPQGFVLGGQPGAGKSSLTEKVKEELKSNLLEINGDNFRKYHPDYEKFQTGDKAESAKATAEFAGAMTEAMFDKAIRERYNIVIEGTFRTAQTPLKTLKEFKENGYETHVLVQTCHKDVSWASCQERYEKAAMINPEEARAVPKEHHDLVCENLAKNIKEISKSNLVDNMAVYARVASKENPNIFAYKELYNKNSNKLANTATIDKYIFGEKKISIDNGMGF